MFYGEIWEIIPKSSQLPLLIWSTAAQRKPNFYLKDNYSNYFWYPDIKNLNQIPYFFSNKIGGFQSKTISKI